MSIKQRINTLQDIFYNTPKGHMNGLQVIEYYRALHPSINTPLNIDFVTMYCRIYKIAMGTTPINVNFQIR